MITNQELLQEADRYDAESLRLRQIASKLRSIAMLTREPMPVRRQPSKYILSDWFIANGNPWSRIVDVAKSTGLPYQVTRNQLIRINGSYESMLGGLYRLKT